MKQRTQEQWRELIEEHQQSGQSISAFCETQGISPTYFSTRRKQLRQPTSSDFVRATMAGSDRHAMVTLRYGQYELHCGTGISPLWLASLLKALA